MSYIASEQPAISTPLRPRRSHSRSDSSSSTHSLNAARIPVPPSPVEPYSYLARSTSISTPTRSRPKGLHSSRPSLDAPVPHPLPVEATQSSLRRSKTVHTANPASVELSPSTFYALPRSESDAGRLADAVSKLPKNPKAWTPSQVAMYLTHVLGLVPRPIVQDVTAYVRSSHMGGRAFLRLSERDLEAQGLNLKWRRLMIEAVRKLRRDSLRGRIWGFEGGSMLSWPGTMDQEERPVTTAAADEDEDEDQPTEVDGIVKGSKGVSKLTLKRMRDSKKVQGMIRAFQNAPTLVEESRCPMNEHELGLDQIQRGHVAASRSASGSGDSAASYSPRPRLAPIFGEGYVKHRAGSFDLERESPMPSPEIQRRPRKSAAEYAFLAGADAASEKPDALDALLASLSPEEAEQLAREMGIADLDVLRSSDVGTQEKDLSVPMLDLVPHLDREDSMSSCSSVTSLSDVEADDDAGADADVDADRYSLLDMDTINSIMAADEPESDHSLGLGLQPQPEPEHETETDASRYRSSMYDDGSLSPKFDTARRRAVPVPVAADVFASAPASVRARGTGTMGMGSRRAKDALRMLRAGDEDGWGSTLGRLSSRKSVNQIHFGDDVPPPAVEEKTPAEVEADAVSSQAEDDVPPPAAAEEQAVLTEADAVPSQAEDGVSPPAAAEEQAVLTEAGTVSSQAEDDVPPPAAAEKQAVLTEADALLLPATLSDGTRSLVLVERRRLAALAARMARLETQLDSLESTPNPQPQPEAEAEASWISKAMALGAVPAYMLGLGAGVGFVIVRQVLTRARRM